MTGQQLLVREDDKDKITGPDDLKGIKVCSVEGSTSLQRVEDEYGAQPVPFATYSECVDQLENETVDAVTTDGAILLGYAAEDPDDLEVVGEPFSEERYGIGFKKGDAEMCQFLNDTHRELVQGRHLGRGLRGDAGQVRRGHARAARGRPLRSELYLTWRWGPGRTGAPPPVPLTARDEEACMDTLIDNFDQILLAFARTIEMVLMAGVLALVVGSFLAALRVSPIPLGRAFGTLVRQHGPQHAAAAHHADLRVRPARARHPARARLQRAARHRRPGPAAAVQRLLRVRDRRRSGSTPPRSSARRCARASTRSRSARPRRPGRSG